MIGWRGTTRAAAVAILIATGAGTAAAQQTGDPPATSPSDTVAREKERLIDGGHGGVAGTGLGKVPDGKDTGKGMSVPGPAGSAVDPMATPPR